MPIMINDVSTFLSSGYGIILQITAFVAAIIPGLKWLSGRLDLRIEELIDEKTEPVVKDICKQLAEVSSALKRYQSETNVNLLTFQGKTDVAIKYLDKAIDGLSEISTQRYIDRYLKDHRDKEDE